MKISVSYLSIKDNLKEKINELTSLNIDYLHLDIMDGKFVLNQTMEFNELKTYINYNKPLDIHLMVKDVINYIDLYRMLNPEFITVHYEIEYDIMEIITYLKKYNIKVGLSIKPNTKIEKIVSYLPFIDLILVMSVEPGKGGQLFINDSINKINKLYDLREKNHYTYLIEVDGGINDQTIKLINKADIAVIGSYITSGDCKERIDKIKESIYG